MSDFDPDWLALREPYDHAARSAILTARFAAAVGATPRLIDLGCGAGSNLRYLAPRIAGAQRWTGIDHDPALLEAARAGLAAWGQSEGWAIAARADGLECARPGGEIRARFEVHDLARELPPSDGLGGMTGAALLDLTSASWLDRLADGCRALPVLMALTFDGRVTLDPTAPEDDEILRRFLAHQRRDKGFGPALGPDAAPYLAERLAARGHQVQLEPAEWRLGPEDGPLIQATIDGIVAAARAITDDPLVDRWARSRREQLAELHLTVGHLDLLAVPG